MGGSTDNLSSLHRHEQKLRDDSLAAIEKRVDLSDHWAIVAEDMNVIHAFVYSHPHESEDELTLQFIGIHLGDRLGTDTQVFARFQKTFF